MSLQRAGAQGPAEEPAWGWPPLRLIAAPGTSYPQGGRGLGLLQSSIFSSGLRDSPCSGKVPWPSYHSVYKRHPFPRMQTPVSVVGAQENRDPEWLQGPNKEPHFISKTQTTAGIGEPPSLAKHPFQQVHLPFGFRCIKSIVKRTSLAFRVGSAQGAVRAGASRSAFYHQVAPEAHRLCSP